MVWQAGTVDRDIAARITQRREALGWSKAELAERIGISKQGFTPYERGDHEFTVQELVRLSRVLEVSVKWLLGDETLDDDEQRLLTAYRAIQSSKMRELAVEQVCTIANVLQVPRGEGEDK